MSGSLWKISQQGRSPYTETQGDCWNLGSRAVSLQSLGGSHTQGKIVRAAMSNYKANGKGGTYLLHLLKVVVLWAKLSHFGGDIPLPPSWCGSKVVLDDVLSTHQASLRPPKLSAVQGKCCFKLRMKLFSSGTWPPTIYCSLPFACFILMIMQHASFDREIRRPCTECFCFCACKEAFWPSSGEMDL